MFVSPKASLFTVLALIAFAGNSVLCRLALIDNAIDPASFTLIRLASGAVLLAILVLLKKQTVLSISARSLSGACALFVYALAFSFAYVSLGTAAGALILFGVVQITLITLSFIKGRKLGVLEWLGTIIAFVGLAYLLLPGLLEDNTNAPSLVGGLLMGLSGIAWGIYTLIGQKSSQPMKDTACSFVLATPIAVIALFIQLQSVDISVGGFVLAVISGAITSGLGYALWYRALEFLSLVQASALQLTVPIIAAVGGLLFAGEAITVQLIISAALVLGGVALVSISNKR